MKNCKTCKHYGFYRMIMDGPYSYAGPIPCHTCVHFSVKEDNYEEQEVPTFGCHRIHTGGHGIIETEF